MTEYFANSTTNYDALGISPNVNDTFREIPFNESDAIVLAIVIGFLVIFGVIANSYIIATVAISSTLRTVFYHFIVSICVSDLISLSVSWIDLYIRTWGYDDFELPASLCKMYWAVEIGTSFVTSLHILSFTSLRLIAIKWPTLMNKITSRHTQIWIATIWVAALTIGSIPMAFFNGVRLTNYSMWPACSHIQEWFHYFYIYEVVVYPIFFYIPIIFTLIICAVTIILMSTQRRTIERHLTKRGSVVRQKQENKVLLQLILIVGSFILGYLPFTIYELKITLSVSDNNINVWQFGIIQHLCLTISQCLNPIVYAMGSSKLRRDAFRLVKPRSFSQTSTFGQLTVKTSTLRNSSLTNNALRKDSPRCTSDRFRREIVCKGV